MVKKIYCKWITLRNGQRIYAENYGLRAFSFEVDEKSTKKEEPAEATADSTK